MPKERKRYGKINVNGVVKTRTVNYSYEYDTLTVFLRPQKPNEKKEVNVGTIDARLSKDYIEQNPELKKQLILFAEYLSKQQCCDGVQLFNIGFRPFTFKEREKR